jgi:hypothetical protein
MQLPLICHRQAGIEIDWYECTHHLTFRAGNLAQEQPPCVVMLLSAARLFTTGMIEMIGLPLSTIHWKSRGAIRAHRWPELLNHVRQPTGHAQEVIQ